MRLSLVAALVGFLLSVSTKVLADLFLHAPLPMFGAWFGLDYATNSGIAFGVVLPHPFQSLLIGFAFVVILWLYRQWLPSPLCCVGMGLVLGGGGANIMDRLGDGAVTDFIVLWPFPLFNVADMNITLGALFLIFAEFWPRRPRKALADFLGKW